MTEDELCALCHATMRGPETGYEATSICHSCAYVVIDELNEQVDAQKATIGDLSAKAADAKIVAATAHADAELQRHRAERAEKRVEVLERQALADAERYRTSVATYQDVIRTIESSRDALKALVDAATTYRFGNYYATQDIGGAGTCHTGWWGMSVWDHCGNCVSCRTDDAKALQDEIDALRERVATLESQLVAAQEFITHCMLSHSDAHDAAERATVEAIAVWLENGMAESGLAVHLRNGDWKKP